MSTTTVQPAVDVAELREVCLAAVALAVEGLSCQTNFDIIFAEIPRVAAAACTAAPIGFYRELVDVDNEYHADAWQTIRSNEALADLVREWRAWADREAAPDNTETPHLTPGFFADQAAKAGRVVAAMGWEAPDDEEEAT